jgi:hypothetical protein
MRGRSLWQEQTSLPLLAYFMTVGALLTALLLLVNFMLAPIKPESSQPVARVETSFPQPRMTMGAAQDPGRIAAVAPAAQAQHALPATTTSPLTQSAQEQSSGSGEMEPKLLPRAKPKKSTAQKPVRGWKADAASRNDQGDAGSSNYAQERPALPRAAQGSSPAEGTLGPH